MGVRGLVVSSPEIGAGGDKIGRHELVRSCRPNVPQLPGWCFSAARFRTRAPPPRQQRVPGRRASGRACPHVQVASCWRAAAAARGRAPACSAAPVPSPRPLRSPAGISQQRPAPVRTKDEAAASPSPLPLSRRVYARRPSGAACRTRFPRGGRRGVQTLTPEARDGRGWGSPAKLGTPRRAQRASVVLVSCGRAGTVTDDGGRLLVLSASVGGGCQSDPRGCHRGARWAEVRGPRAGRVGGPRSLPRSELEPRRSAEVCWV